METGLALSYIDSSKAAVILSQTLDETWDATNKDKKPNTLWILTNGIDYVQASCHNPQEPRGVEYSYYHYSNTQESPHIEVRNTQDFSVIVNALAERQQFDMQNLF